MTEEIKPGRAKAKYAVAAVAAIIFLLILPGVVLAIASNMTGVELRLTRDERPVPEHQFLGRRNIAGGFAVWLRVPEETSDKDMKRIIRHLIAKRLPERKRMTFYIFDQSDPNTNRWKRPSMDQADQTIKWSLTSGIEFVE